MRSRFTPQRSTERSLAKTHPGYASNFFLLPAPAKQKRNFLDLLTPDTRQYFWWRRRVFPATPWSREGLPPCAERPTAPRHATRTLARHVRRPRTNRDWTEPRRRVPGTAHNRTGNEPPDRMSTASIGRPFLIDRYSIFVIGAAFSFAPLYQREEHTHRAHSPPPPPPLGRAQRSSHVALPQSGLVVGNYRQRATAVRAGVCGRESIG